MQAQAAANWPVYTPADPYFFGVSLLLNGDGTNGAQNNTFLDSSSNSITLTRNGNLTQGSFNPYGTLWSNQTTAASSYFTLGNPSQLNPGSGDFTIEGWFNGIEYGSAGYTPLYAKYESAGRNDFFIGAYSDGSMEFAVQDTSNAYYSITAPATTTSLGVWYHFALVRNGATLTAYLNGVSLGTSNIGTATVRNSANIAISKLYGYGSNVNGGAYFSNYRYVSSAVYTSNFTPSTVPLTAISGTQLLTFQSNKFVDNSSNNLTITLNGTPFVQPFSPFNPTSAYSTTTNGGSAYFSTSSNGNTFFITFL
jgi:hypothetical protein